MPGLSDLVGKNGVLEQILLWRAVGAIIDALAQPALDALAQDVESKHPNRVLDPATLADLAARQIVTEADAAADATKSGMDGARFRQLYDRATVRIQPADVATAILRSYMDTAAGEAEVRPQGVSADRLKILTDLAGDAPGPELLAAALRRGVIPHDGTGPDAVSYVQGIAESRLHDKYAAMLLKATAAILSAPDAASAVVRNFLSSAEGQAAAAQWGVDAATFETMVHLSGDAPGPEQLAVALRRGAIPRDGTGADSTSFEQGIAEGRLADKWAPVIEDISRVWPTPADALNAVLKGDIPADQGMELYGQLGGDTTFYPWLLASIGDAPSPLEAASMAARGIIAWDGEGPDNTSFAQAIREGRLRDKWTPSVKASTVYFPAPSTIITFLSQGAIDKDQAAALLAQHNMAPDDITRFINEADLAATTDDRGLTVGQVTNMYYAQMLDQATAQDMLEKLHVAPAAAALMLHYADLRQVIDSIQRSVQRIAQLFTGRKISAQTASSALQALGIGFSEQEKLIQAWEVQAAANVKLLTEAQIVDAWYYQIIDQPTAVEELTAIGYTPYDAWVILSVKAKGPLEGAPERIVAAPPGAVIPGVT